MSIKQQLHQQCRLSLLNSIAEIETAIEGLRESVHNETKSSMGDKYETTREMLQQDINMNAERLAKAKADLSLLDTIAPNTQHHTITQGSLVSTTQGNFYIAVSAGQLVLNGVKYYIISPSSPIALVMKGATQGETFVVNGRLYTVEEIV